MYWGMSKAKQLIPAELHDVQGQAAEISLPSFMYWCSEHSFVDEKVGMH
jgi:hypothetical protein